MSVCHQILKPKPCLLDSVDMPVCPVLVLKTVLLNIRSVVNVCAHGGFAGECAKSYARAGSVGGAQCQRPVASIQK